MGSQVSSIFPVSYQPKDNWERWIVDVPFQSSCSNIATEHRESKRIVRYPLPSRHIDFEIINGVLTNSPKKATKPAKQLFEEEHDALMEKFQLRHVTPEIEDDAMVPYNAKFVPAEKYLMAQRMAEKKTELEEEKKRAEKAMNAEKEMKAKKRAEKEKKTEKKRAKMEAEKVLAELTKRAEMETEEKNDADIENEKPEISKKEKHVTQAEIETEEKNAVDIKNAKPKRSKISKEDKFVDFEIPEECRIPVPRSLSIPIPMRPNQSGCIS